MPALSADFFGDIGGGISSIFGAVGDLKEADAYKKASSIATQNAVLERESTGIQLAQQGRKVFQTLGAQAAQVGAAGLSASGSSLDVLRGSVQQGSLQKQLISLQGGIQENSFKQEAASYQGMAGAAKAAAGGGILGGLFKVAAAVVPMMLSDERTKKDIVLLGHRPDGIGIYEYTYLGDDIRWVGPIAQDVQKVYPDAVQTNEKGFLELDCDAINFFPTRV